jgi:hypothetical protein
MQVIYHLKDHILCAVMVCYDMNLIMFYCLYDSNAE